MQTRKLGPFMVSAVGLGAMPFSMGERVSADRDQAIATVHAALDAGVTYIDTADIYAPSWNTMGHNEEVMAEALAARGDTSEVIVGTKGGTTRGPGESWGRDGLPEYLRRAVEASLRALRREVIDLYQWHRPDRSRVYGQVIETFKALQNEGKIRAELEHCGQHGIAFLPWSPLGGTGSGSKEVGQTYPVFQEIGERHGVSPQQVVIAWELSPGEHVIPIPGASRPASISDSALAVHLRLTEDELTRIEGQFR